MHSKKIIVAGDICIDWLYHTYSGKNPRDKGSLKTNWQITRNTRLSVLPGGVLLLNEFIKSSTGVETICYKTPDLKRLSSDRMVNSIAEISSYQSDLKKGSSYRISRFLGFNGPEVKELSQPQEIHGDLKNPDLIVLDDAGNGFRDEPELWEEILNSADTKTEIIYKMSWPLFQGKLFESLVKSHVHQMILIMNADDLREDGLNISRKLSWEKTLLDFIQKIPGYKSFYSVSNCPHILIRFGLEGVLHYFKEQNNNKNSNAVEFYFFPNYCEGELQESTTGNMQGLTASFTAAIAGQISKKGGAENMAFAIPQALNSARSLLLNGYLMENGEPIYPVTELFQSDHTKQVKNISLPPVGSSVINPDEWSILNEETQMKSDLDIAMNYVIHGSSADLTNVPIVQFRGLVLIDRKEIEKFRTVRNLMKEYINKGNTGRPLSIGIFGPPGSGKSFGVKQLAKVILGNQVSSVEFNLSQFQSLQELIRAFHQIRDYTLKGVVPLIFFDEFDSTFNSEALGWLKYFLAPMQDGEFRDGEAIHPLGKAIFIFAGGTSSSFDEFSRESEQDIKRLLDFKGAKGPDFISRLKGYVNITGVNQVDVNDRLHVIRRAIILRALLKRQKGIVDNNQKIHIDEDVLRAMLIIPKYKHGSRSIESIIEMSKLSARSKFEKSALPPKEQLNLHVDGIIFTELLDKDLFYASAGDLLAKEIHNQFIINQQKKKVPKPADHPSMQSWEKLSRDLKESNRQQAYDFFVKLLQVQSFYQKQKSGNQNSFEFTDEEIEVLAEMEHKRWNSEKIDNGWRYGKVRDDKNKIHDCLIPWIKLSEEIKGYDRDAVRAIPLIFDKAGYEIYRL